MPCPICTKAAEAPYAPFCSRRCADLDLGKWFNGGYALPSDEPLDESSIEEVIAAHSAEESH